MTNLRQTGDDKDEAARFIASQAAREVAALDVVSVYYAALAKIEAGLVEEAKAIVAEYRKQAGK